MTPSIRSQEWMVYQFEQGLIALCSERGNWFGKWTVQICCLSYHDISIPSGSQFKFRSFISFLIANAACSARRARNAM